MCEGLSSDNRRCSKCGTILSRYNSNKMCFYCIGVKACGSKEKYEQKCLLFNTTCCSSSRQPKLVEEYNYYDY